MIRKVKLALGSLFLSQLIACVQSDSPTSEELIKTRVPTFLGLQNNNFTSSSTSYVLNGECDTISKGLEWSYDNATWTTIPGGCPAGVFTINVTIAGLTNVYVRAKTKLGQTLPGIASIRFVLPPTAPAFQFVTAASATNLFAAITNMDFTMSGTTTGTPGVSAANNLDTHITGIVYGP